VLNNSVVPVTSEGCLAINRVLHRLSVVLFRFTNGCNKGWMALVWLLADKVSYTRNNGISWVFSGM